MNMGDDELQQLQEADQDLAMAVRLQREEQEQHQQQMQQMAEVDPDEMTYELGSADS